MNNAHRQIAAQSDGKILTESPRLKTKIYLASSWRNEFQPSVCIELRQCGFDVYDFRNPKDGDNGFGWKQIDEGWQSWSFEKYRECLDNPIAISGFNSDFEAMKWADCGVLLLPCGRSAHLEAGYFVGANKPLHIVKIDGAAFEPELMYRMATSINSNMFELIRSLDKTQS